jgi:hypothetical protein
MLVKRSQLITGAGDPSSRLGATRLRCDQGFRRPSLSLRTVLSTQAQALDQGAVSFDILFLQVLQKPLAATDEAQKAPA